MAIDAFIVCDAVYFQQIESVKLVSSGGVHQLPKNRALSPL
jgi:hypothetical protein